jgi:hypothetical protein
VIDGFRIDMTVEELSRHLERRIQHHREAADECDSKRVRVEAVTPPDDDDEEGHFMACWPGYAGELDRRAARHRHSEAALIFLRDHLIAREIYRLDERDLQLLELWPRRTAAGMDA